MQRIKIVKIDIFNNDFWKLILSTNFNSLTNISVDKGYNILDSLETTYDIITKESTSLPEEEKKDIYAILRWLTREFNELRLKNNVDITTKKFRRPEYMAAAPYATKLSKGIYRAKDQKKITCKEIERYINVDPNFLIDSIAKDKLVSYRNNVNDNDGIAALKFSYKGAQGIENMPPDVYRRIHWSSMGKLDPDTSSASDPGMTGLICPLAPTKNKTFNVDDCQEPLAWQDSFDELIQEYRNAKGRRDLISFKQDMNMLNDLEASIALQNIDSEMETIKTAIEVNGALDESIEEVECINVNNNGKSLFIIFDDKL